MHFHTFPTSFWPIVLKNRKNISKIAKTQLKKIPLLDISFGNTATLITLDTNTNTSQELLLLLLLDPTDWRQQRFSCSSMCSSSLISALPARPSQAASSALSYASTARNSLKKIQRAHTCLAITLQRSVNKVLKH